MPSERNEYRPATVSPPGDTLLETLAARAGVPAELAARIVVDHGPLTWMDAAILASALGVPASFWMERERMYRESMSEQEPADEH